MANFELPALQDLMIDNNPIDTNSAASREAFREQFPNLLYLNLNSINAVKESQNKAGEAEENARIAPSSTTQTVVKNKSELGVANAAASTALSPREIVLNDGPVPIRLPVFKPKNECNVIKIIQKEWEREVMRLNSR